MTPQSRYRQRAAGRCEDCARRLSPRRRGKHYCRRCQQRYTERKRARAAARVVLCVACDQVIPFRIGHLRRKFCPTCQPVRRSTNSLRWQAAHPKLYAAIHRAAATAYQAKQRAQGRCILCGDRAATKRNGRLSVFCPWHLRAKRRVYWRRKFVEAA